MSIPAQQLPSIDRVTRREEDERCSRIIEDEDGGDCTQSIIDALDERIR